MSTFQYFSLQNTQDKWAALADKRSLERMCFLLDLAESEEACDVGTGRGSGAGAIAEHAKRVVTFDIANQSAHVSNAGIIQCRISSSRPRAGRTAL